MDYASLAPFFGSFGSRLNGIWALGSPRRFHHRELLLGKVATGTDRRDARLVLPGAAPAQPAA
jgi:hypothetical protein